MTSRRELEVIKLKNAIIDESWKIIQEEGWQALSIRKIADAISYSVPVIYKHFENKEAILAHFSREGFRLLYEDLSFALKDLTQIEERIQVLAHAYWKFASENTAYYRIMFGLGIPSCQVINSSDEMLKTSQLMMNVIEDVLKAAHNDSVDIHVKFRSFWSMLHGLIAIELLSNDSIPHTVSENVNDAIDGFIFILKNKK